MLVGGEQSAEQLVLTALAEDAAELVVVGDDEDLSRVDAVRRALAIEVTLTDGADLLRARRV